MEDTMKGILGLLAILGTLTVLQPSGEVRLFATFPMGSQVSLLDLDTGRTWMVHSRGERGNQGDIIDYDNGEIYHWDYTDGCRRCGDWLQHEE
jgi:hypothetical protein